MSVHGEFDVMQKKDANAPVLWSDFEGLRDSLQRSIQLTADGLDADVQAVQTKLQETDTSVKDVQTQVTTLQTSVDVLTQSVEAIRVMMQRNEAQHPKAWFDDASVGDNAKNPFALGHGRGFAPIGAQCVPVFPAPGAAPRHDDGPSRPKFTIPQFHGNDFKEYLNWELKVEKLWRLHEYTEERKVQLASSEFEVLALIWWDHVCNVRVIDRVPAIVTWRTMKEEMWHRFVPANYVRSLYDKLTNLKQGLKTVDEYFYEMEIIMQRAKVREPKDQTMQRFLARLSFQIRRCNIPARRTTSG
jgi:hypothetical protein